MVSTNRLGLTILFGLAVFLFWRFRYPFALTYQEQFQLFLFDSDYFTERIAEPGGLARYIGARRPYPCRALYAYAASYVAADALWSSLSH